MGTIDTMSTRHGVASRLEGRRLLSVLAGLFTDLGLRLERQRSRNALAALEPHELGDVGISREAALREARRPFWD